MTVNKANSYSSVTETSRILKLLCDQVNAVSLPPAVRHLVPQVKFTAARDFPYFPIPLKETETGAALKAIEGGVACLLADLKDGEAKKRQIVVDLEKTTAFLCQAYMATVGGQGKLDPGVKKLLKDTDLLHAQSISYRRMSANLYETKVPGEYYHIHGSLEASTTLGMIGLEPFRPDLESHEDIVRVIEGAVTKYSTAELEELNAKNRQAGVPALKHEDFLKTLHGKTNIELQPWTVENLETETPKVPLSPSSPGQKCRPLEGIKVLELCRIIAGPVITRILGEYGADVLKITSPNLSDVPFFQVDGNMGKHAAELDLKTPEGREKFAVLLAEADVVVDGYRPGALERLGYGAASLTKLAKERGKGFVYVNENCFGYEGEWANRPGWQQIADCVSGVAWEQGKFMGLNEPVVPPFPISDYGTGCIGAIAALTGLYHRATQGGSWHGKASLLQYDLLLFKAGKYSDEVQEQLRKNIGDDFLALRHAHSVDQISGTALRRMRETCPEIFKNGRLLDTWYSAAYKADVEAVLPVVEVDGLDIGFRRASRPNGSDKAQWDFSGDEDYRKSA
ncbi:CoA-transferase family III domain-containing protein [Ilyonectria robusta]|uniref:CoA-transferase family III domain-containing protein n=1 Tax=Ilyonectria robusta TaxID=1079257 RepID=UPI001E8EEA5A|nr:CoA-transferase family III domain-containing protein [Ilyonectria robusta]KAH8694496.1 CoA-transferase family III domain-containing protein [Ilyonectria robusta]